MSQKAGRNKLTTRLVGGGALVVLVVAMLLNTKFLTPEEVEALTPEQFDPQATAGELHSTVQQETAQDPAELSELAAALDEDSEAAAEQYDAMSPSEGVEAYAVTLTGTVEEGSADSLILDVDGIDSARQIVVPLTTAVDGNLIRDISGFRFGDAPGQTEYQQVGGEISSLMTSALSEALGDDPENLSGETVSVDGVLRYMVTDSEGADERPLIIQALSVEVGS